MAFAEQFIYLCLRHFRVLQAASYSASSASAKDIFGASSDLKKESVRTIAKTTIEQTKRTFKEDDCITDRTSGGKAVRSSDIASMATRFPSACSRSAPLASGPSA